MPQLATEQAGDLIRSEPAREAVAIVTLCQGPGQCRRDPSESLVLVTSSPPHC
jgi:hypothetical protein